MKRTMMVLALLLATAAPSAAQQVEPEPLPSEQPALVLLQQLGGARDDAARVALFDRALAMLLQPTPLRGKVLCARAVALGNLDRHPEARESLDQCRQLRPNDPNVVLVIAVDELRQHRPVEAANLVARAAALAPAALSAVDVDWMESLLRQLRYLGRGDVADTTTDTLAHIGYARDNPAAFSDYVESAIHHRLAVGDTAEATRLVPSIVSPNAGMEMLIDRQFAPIWPAVEQWAGDDLSVPRRALLAGARSTFETTGSATARLAYADALFMTGHHDDAIALLDEWLATDVDPQSRWHRSLALVKEAKWLAYQGQRVEAIKRMRAAIATPQADDASVGNVVPNLVIHLLLARDYAEALDVLDHHTPLPGALESPVAAGYFVALRACALEGLGRHDQAVVQSQRLEAVYPTAEAARKYATACVAPVEEQARLWIARARNPAKRSGALLELVSARYRKKMALPVLMIDEVMMRRIENRADISRTFDELGRALPERYEPALNAFKAAPAPVRRTGDAGPVA